MFDGIYDAIHREMYKLEDKYANGTQLSGQDLTDIDKMAHAMKCLATYEAMVTAKDHVADTYVRSQTADRYSVRDDGYRRRY